MPFLIQPVLEFLVRPALPEALERMSELSYNVLWSWEPNIRLLFRRLDQRMWKASGHNPVLMLGSVPQETLERAASDPRYLALYRRACERYDAYMSRQPSWDKEYSIAYFSMEYGIVECLQSYSGGLGMLAGDFLKACSDLDIPIVGIGLLYQKGYLQQYLNPDGWQQERTPNNDFYTLPIRPTQKDDKDLVVDVRLPTGTLYLKVWEMAVGRVKLYLLDSNIPQNERADHRDVTDQLYGGDAHTRIRQEIALGIGGLRVLKALNIDPTVYHMNEGHSTFLAIERIRLLMQEYRLSFAEALEATRYNNVFTTHTSVPAGIDVFDQGLIYEYFSEYCREAGIDWETFNGLGRSSLAGHDKFLTPVMAMRTSAYKNAVSELHRTVSQDMFQGMWPNLPPAEVPIASITNGMHLLTWLNSDLALLYDQYLQPDWRERHRDVQTWKLVDDIPDHELLEVHRRRKMALITFVRERQVEAAQRRKASAAELRRAAEVLDPNAFTIGFARRFATYKRATLFLRDVERLRKILLNQEFPVQLIIAGKAHPKDHPGKMLIREIFQLSRDPELSKHLVFLEDYGIHVARYLVQGVDLWLNNPVRGQEACGTSGMKAGINGVLNFSVLDGWFDEAYEISGGWGIGEREPYSEDQDEVHARSLYSVLENEIVPTFYDRPDRVVPREWMRRVKMSLTNLSPLYDCRRMVDEYVEKLYLPAHSAYESVRAAKFEKACKMAHWHSTVSRAWDRVQFVEVGPKPDGPVISGEQVVVDAAVDLAGLTPEDVRVEVLLGRVGAEGDLEETEIQELAPKEQRPGSSSKHVWVFSGRLLPRFTGRLGFAVRVSPNHFTDPLTRPCEPVIKWYSSRG
jgi:glycogen phosphorylase